ncbi:hypothetical protein STEG23_006999, partial [Scotinomys teguina]
KVEMSHTNSTVPAEFILTQITHRPELQLPLLGVFLVIYGIAMIGNLSLIILTELDSRLHTPMYYFIRHLAFIDLGNCTVIYPKMMVNFVVDQNVISYYACAIQMAFYITFIISELFMLSAMAYDRYVAICNPLLYSAIMSQRRCQVLVGIPYLYSIFQAVMITSKIFTLTFCGSNVISHFYCDNIPVLLLLCSNPRDIELLIILFSALNLISSLSVVLVSYLLIVRAIYGMNSAEGPRNSQSPLEKEDPGVASPPGRKRTQQHPDTIGTRDLPCPPSKAEMGRCQCKSTYNNTKNKASLESSPPPTPGPEHCNVDKTEENDFKNSLMKMIEEALKGKMKNAIKEIEEKTNKKLEEKNKEIEEKNKKIKEMNKEIEDKNLKMEEIKIL